MSNSEEEDQPLDDDHHDDDHTQEELLEELESTDQSTLTLSLFLEKHSFGIDHLNEITTVEGLFRWTKQRIEELKSLNINAPRGLLDVYIDLAFKFIVSNGQVRNEDLFSSKLLDISNQVRENAENVFVIAQLQEKTLKAFDTGYENAAKVAWNRQKRVQVLKLRSVALEEEKQTLEGKKQTLEGEKQDLEDKLSAEEAKTADLTAKLAEAETKAGNLAAKLKAEEDKTAGVVAELANHKNNVDAINFNLAEEKKKSEALATQLSKLQEQMNVTKDENEALKARPSLDRLVDIFNNQIVQLQQEKETTKIQFSEVVTGLSQVYTIAGLVLDNVGVVVNADGNVGAEEQDGSEHNSEVGASHDDQQVEDDE